MAGLWGNRATLLCTTALALMWSAAGHTQSLPAGGNVTSGAATIVRSGSNLLVNQSSQNAIISWDSFSVGGSASAHFENGTGATLNRVTGTLPSSIDGSLTATGSLYLINPAGIAVGTGGMVRTGGSFVASTHDAADADFLDGGALTLKGAGKASVVNKGFITSLSGDVVLTARRVENAGTIEAPNGSVGLLGGYEVEMRDTSLADGKFAVKLGGPDTEVVNSGTVRAAEIEMRANGGSVQALAGNTKAIVKATGVKKVGGRIFLTAGNGGTVKVRQKMVARRAAQAAQKAGIASLPDFGPLPAARPDFSGGEVHVAGGTVGLGGEIDAAGAGAAGGTVMAIATGALAMDGGALLDASGSSGGFVETSGATVGIGDGATVVARGASGPAGTWLIDPEDLAIDAAAATTISAALDGGTNTALQTTATTASGTGVVTPGGAGDITVAAPVSWNSSATLTLDAYHSVAIDAPMTIAGAGGLALVTNNGGSGGTLSFAGGVQYTGTPNGGQSLTINNQAYTLLYSMSDMQGINTGLSGSYALAGSLDATGVPGFIPLGNIVTDFTGNFTGLGNIIGNLEITSGGDYVGLFGYSSGAISDIGLVGGSVAGNNSVGGLVGRQVGGSIANAWTTGTVAGQNDVGGLVGWQDGSITRSWAAGAVSGSSYVGGLVGWQTSSASISRAYATGRVTATGGFAGGLIGFQNNSSLSQAYATGAVTAAGDNVGGLVGYLYLGSITQAYATGAVTGSGDFVGGLIGVQASSANVTQTYATGKTIGGNPSYTGGLVGAVGGGTVADSYFDSYSTGQTNAYGTLLGATASISAVTSDPAQSGAANYAYSQPAYGNLTFITTPGGSGWYMIDGQTRPFGAWEYSRHIGNSHQLQLVNMDLGASYTLARGLDLAGEFGRAGVASPTAANSAGMWNRGFVPLGTDGAGTVLNGGNGFAGTFDGLGNTISNLTVDIGSSDLAGLFGLSNGAISDIGLVGGSVTGGSNVGGLVGVQSIGSITRAYATGAVTGANLVGGLVGYLNGTITQAYASGAVTGTDLVGGLVGYQQGGIDQAYATGAVTGGSEVGGLVGSQLFGTITQAYATGAVTGTANVGGLVGHQHFIGSIADSYFDSYSTGQNVAVGVQESTVTNVTAVTSDPAQAAAADYAYRQSAYAANPAWTFTTTPDGSGWYMIDGQTRPFGAWEYSKSIANSHQLQLVNMDLGASYMLPRGLDLAGEFGRAGVASPTAADSAGMWNRGFVPLGTDGTGLVLNNGFAGTFDGQDKTIANLAVDTASAYTGLFGYSSGDIANIGIVDGQINGVYFVGGLVGVQAGGSIDNAYATGAVSGYQHVGGLVGRLNAGSVTKSYATGAVTGNDWVGGLVGQTAGSITEAYATGAVRGDNSVGGLAGYQVGGSIAQAYAMGAVKGGENVGGLVGSQNAGSITQAYATGAVAGTNFVGGLVGTKYDSVAQVYATGAVTGTTWVGGLIGLQLGIGVVDGYYDTETTGQTGGTGVGLTTAALQAALQAGFDSSAWGTLPGISYPYLKWRFPDGPSVVSGTAIDIPGGNDRLGVGLGIDGDIVAWGHTGANGYYNFMVDPAAAGSSAITWLTGERFAGATTTSRANAVGEMPASGILGIPQGVAGDLDLYAETVNVETALPAYTDIAAMMSRALYGDGSVSLPLQLPDVEVLRYDATCGCDVAFYPGDVASPQASVRIDASAPLLTWDGSFDSLFPPLNATVLAAGDVVVASGNGIGAGDINSLPTGGSLVMTVGGDLTVQQDSGIIAGTGPLTLTVGGDLSMGTDALLAALGGDLVATVDGNIDLGGAPNNVLQIFGTNTVRVSAGGDFTMAPETHLAATGTGDALQLAVGGKFDNQSGADAFFVDPSTARWLVYLASPAGGHDFGGLDSGNTAVWNTDAFDPVAAAGNRYVFAYQPTLTFTSGDASKTYGDTGTTFTYTVSGLMGGVTGAYLGDTTGSAYSGTPLLSSLGDPATADAGSYAIAIVDNGMTSAAGYAFAFSSLGTLTVTPRAITVSALGGTSVYGDSPSDAGLSASNLANGEAVTVLTGLSNSFGIGPTSGAGSHALGVAGTLGNGNYVVTGTVGGVWTVTPAALTVTADAGSKVYGDGDPALGYMASGWKNGEGAAGVLTGSLARVAGEDVGSYAINQGSLAANANYTIAYSGASLAITPAALTVTASDGGMVYGDAAGGLSYTASGWKNGQTDALLGGVTVTTDATSTSHVGASYATSASGGVLSGAAAGNYSLSYVDGAFAVTPRAITVSADDRTRAYGDANPALGFTVGGPGLVNGDTLTGALATAAGATSAVGGYAITQDTLAASADYALTFNPGTLTVTPRAITVSADDQSRLLGEPDPELTWTITGGSLASFDTLGGVFNGALARASGEAVGTYAIGQGSLVATANYRLGFVPGSFSIEPTRHTGSQALEQPQDDQPPPLLSASAQDGACMNGVLGPDCIAYVDPTNRNLGPNIGVAH